MRAKPIDVDLPSHAAPQTARRRIFTSVALSSRDSAPISSRERATADFPE